jgi:hypothetical protein
MASSTAFALSAIAALTPTRVNVASLPSLSPLDALLASLDEQSIALEQQESPRISFASSSSSSYFEHIDTPTVVVVVEEVAEVIKKPSLSSKVKSVLKRSFRAFASLSSPFFLLPYSFSTVPSQQASAAPLATLPPLRAPPTAPSPSSPSPRLLPLLLPRAPSPPPPPTSAPATTLSTLSPALKTGPTARQPAPTSRRPSPPLLRPLSRAPPPSSPPPRARPFLPLLPLRLRSRAPARATARCGGDSPLSLFVRFLPSLSSLLVPHSCLFLLSYHSYLFLQTRVLISAAVALETKRSRKIASTKTTMRGEPASATTAATVPSLHRMRRLPLATPPFLSTAQHEGKNERKNGELEIAPYYC